MGGSTEEQGSEWPEPRVAAKAAEQGLGKVLKGRPCVKVQSLEDQTPEEPLSGVLVMATVECLATNISDIAVY